MKACTPAQDRASRETAASVRILDRGQPPFGDDVLGDRLSTDQMFLNDPLENFRRAVTVPGTLRIDDGDRPLYAHLKTVRFRAVDAAVPDQSQLNQALLQIVPRDEAVGVLRTFRRGLVAAQHDVPANSMHAEAVEFGPQFGVGGLFLAHCGMIREPI